MCFEYCAAWRTAATVGNVENMAWVVTAATEERAAKEKRAATVEKAAKE